MAKSITEMYKKLLEEQSNPIVVAAIAQMRLRQHAIKAEQDVLLANNKIALEEKCKDMSGEALAKKIKADVRQDQQHIGAFDSSLKVIEISDTPKFNAVPWAVRTHKMNLIIDGTITKLFGEDETNIMHLVSGKLPVGFENEVNEFPVLGSGRFWGTSKPTYLSYGILAVNFSLNGHTIQDIPLTSTITHVAPLPADITLDSNCRFSYRAKTSAGIFNCFGYVHSGYSFGGYRADEQHLHYSKPFGPEDCSSVVAKMTGCPTLFSTMDQLYTYRTALSGFIPPTWSSSNEARDMVGRYEAVAALENVQPGDIYFHRRFNIANAPETSGGAGGHTAIVLGRNQENIVTLGFNRDMPGLEGFGIQEFPLSDSMDKKGNSKKVMFLRAKPHI